MSEEIAVLVLGLVAALCVVWLVWLCVRARRRRRALYRSIAERVNRQQLVAGYDVDGLLQLVRSHEWTAHAFPNKTNPDVLAWTHDHGDYTDVIIMRGADSATVFRTLSETANPLAPDMIVWAWAGPADMALRMVLTLPKPGEPDAPSRPHEPPPGFGGIRPDESGRLTYRPRQSRWS